MRKMLMLTLLCLSTAQAIQNPTAMNQQRALQSMVPYKCSVIGTVTYDTLDDALYFAGKGIELDYRVAKVGNQYMITGFAKTITSGFVKFATLTSTTKQSGGYYVTTCFSY